MEAQLSFTRFLHRMDLRAQVIRAQEIVGDPQATGGVSF
jgi:hypothetical protein